MGQVSVLYAGGCEFDSQNENTVDTKISETSKDLHKKIKKSVTIFLKFVKKTEKLQVPDNVQAVRALLTAQLNDLAAKARSRKLHYFDIVATLF